MAYFDQAVLAHILRYVESACWVIFHDFLPSADFFKINLFKKSFQVHYQCQAVWVQIRPDVLSGLIWVQTVCKDYQ